MPKYSIVVPVYRGGKSLIELTKRLISTFNSINNDFEIVFVYDCGPGNSWNIINNLRLEYPFLIKAIRLSRNFGQHNATICGFKYTEGSFIITMDEDLQHRPEDIPLLIENMNKTNADVTYGKYHELKHSPFRNATSAILKKMLQISLPDLHPDYTAFRLIKAPIAKATLNMNNSYTFLDGYISWITTNVASVTVNHEERSEGKSAYTITKLINHAINIFVTFSILPIRIVTFSSFIIFLLSLSYSLYIFFRKIFFNDFISGYASTMIFMGLGIGLILFALGVIGEYLHRVNLKTTQKPNFVESEVLHSEQQFAN